MATKSRTDFSSEIEYAPRSPPNQNALDDPPSRFRARCNFKSGANPFATRILPSSARVTSEQNPIAARSDPVVQTKVRRAERVLFSPGTVSYTHLRAHETPAH